MKLYRVMLRKQTLLGAPYVLANGPTEAYEKVKTYLDSRDLGFHDHRELFAVELCAEDGDYPRCGTMLFL